MNFDPSTTAILLIEYQNEFTSDGGVLHGAVKGVMAETNMLANTVELVRAARKRGVTIMHAPITFAPGYAELTRHPYGILKGVVDGKAFIQITRDGTLDPFNEQFDFVAVTKDGRHLERSGHSESGLGKVTTERLIFDTPLEQVQTFRTRKRPIHKVKFYNIPLP